MIYEQINKTFLLLFVSTDNNQPHKVMRKKTLIKICKYPNLIIINIIVCVRNYNKFDLRKKISFNGK